MLESWALSDFISQHARFFFTNYEQVYREINHFLILVVYYNFVMSVKSEPCSRLNGYCVEEQRRIQKSAKDLMWSF